MEPLQEPEGIGFYNIKSDETHYAKLEPTIQAYINSSDMGINASRDQDFGWRLEPKWVKAVRDFQNDEDKMDTLSAKLRLEDGVSPNTIQILLYIYGRQVRAYLQRLRDDDTPYAEKYQQAIARPQRPAPTEPVMDPITEDVSEADLEPADDTADFEMTPETEAPKDKAAKPEAKETKPKTTQKQS